MLEQGEYYEYVEPFGSEEDRHDLDPNIDPALQDLPFADDPFFVNTTPETMSVLTQKMKADKAKGKGKAKVKEIVKYEPDYDNDTASPEVSPEDEFRPDEYLYEFTPYDPTLPHQALVDLSLQSGDDDGQPEHIKRITNKFMVFRKHFGRNYKHVYDPVTGLPTKPIPQKFISKMAGHIWSTMDARARQPYEHAYNDLKEAFVKAHPDYKYTPMKKAEKAARRAEARERKRQEAEMKKIDQERARLEDKAARKAAGMTIKDWTALKAAQDPHPKRRRGRQPKQVDIDEVKDEEEDDLPFEHAALPKHLEGHVIQAMQILEKNSDMDAGEALAQAINPRTPEEDKFVRPITMPALPMMSQVPLGAAQSLYHAYRQQFQTPMAQHTYPPPNYPPPFNNFRETRPLPQRALTAPTYMSAQLALANQMAMNGHGHVQDVTYQPGPPTALGSPFMTPICEGPAASLPPSPTTPTPAFNGGTTANPKRRRPELTSSPTADVSADPIRASITKPSLYDGQRAPGKDFFWSGRTVAHPTKGWVRADTVGETEAGPSDAFSVESLINPMRKASIAMQPNGEIPPEMVASTSDPAVEAIRRASIDIVMDERRSLSLTWRTTGTEGVTLKVTPIQQPLGGTADPGMLLNGRRPSQFRVSFSVRQPNQSSKRRISYSAQGGRSRQPSWAETAPSGSSNLEQSDDSQDWSQDDVVQFNWPLPEPGQDGEDEWGRFQEISNQLASFIPAGLGSSLATLPEEAGAEAYAWLNSTLEAYRNISGMNGPYDMQQSTGNAQSPPVLPGFQPYDFLGASSEHNDPEYTTSLEDFVDFEKYDSAAVGAGSP